MPSLIMIIAGMLVYAMNMDAFSKAVSYMFNPDWSKLTSEAFAVAVGHAFFYPLFRDGGNYDLFGIITQR